MPRVVPEPATAVTKPELRGWFPPGVGASTSFFYNREYGANMKAVGLYNCGLAWISSAIACFDASNPKKESSK